MQFVRTAMPRDPSHLASDRTVRQRTAVLERIRAVVSGRDAGDLSCRAQMRHELARLPKEDRRLLLKDAGLSVLPNNVLAPGTGLALDSFSQHFCATFFDSHLYFRRLRHVSEPTEEKRKQLEYDSIAKIETADVGCRATVHGIVASLSPVKSGPAKKYYRGVLADNDKSIPFVAFSHRNAEPPGHDLLQAFREKGDPVIIGNCEVKTSNFTGIPKAELQVHSTTVFEKSLKSFDETVVLEESEESEQLSMKHITLSQLIEE